MVEKGRLCRKNSDIFSLCRNFFPVLNEKAVMLCGNDAEIYYISY